VGSGTVVFIFHTRIVPRRFGANRGLFPVWFCRDKGLGFSMRTKLTSPRGRQGGDKRRAGRSFTQLSRGIFQAEGLIQKYLPRPPTQTLAPSFFVRHGLLSFARVTTKKVCSVEGPRQSCNTSSNFELLRSTFSPPNSLLKRAHGGR